MSIKFILFLDWVDYRSLKRYYNLSDYYARCSYCAPSPCHLWKVLSSRKLAQLRSTLGWKSTCKRAFRNQLDARTWALWWGDMWESRMSNSVDIKQEFHQINFLHHTQKLSLMKIKFKSLAWVLLDTHIPLLCPFYFIPKLAASV